MIGGGRSQTGWTSNGEPERETARTHVETSNGERSAATLRRVEASDRRQHRSDEQRRLQQRSDEQQPQQLQGQWQPPQQQRQHPQQLQGQRQHPQQAANNGGYGNDDAWGNNGFPLGSEDDGNFSAGNLAGRTGGPRQFQPQHTTTTRVIQQRRFRGAQPDPNDHTARMVTGLADVARGGADMGWGDQQGGLDTIISGAADTIIGIAGAVRDAPPPPPKEDIKVGDRATVLSSYPDDQRLVGTSGKVLKVFPGKKGAADAADRETRFLVSFPSEGVADKIQEKHLANTIDVPAFKVSTGILIRFKIVRWFFFEIRAQHY